MYEIFVHNKFKEHLPGARLIGSLVNPSPFNRSSTVYTLFITSFRFLLIAEWLFHEFFDY